MVTPDRKDGACMPDPSSVHRDEVFQMHASPIADPESDPFLTSAPDRHRGAVALWRVVKAVAAVTCVVSALVLARRMLDDGEGVSKNVSSPSRSPSSSPVWQPSSLWESRKPIVDNNSDFVHMAIPTRAPSSSPVRQPSFLPESRKPTDDDSFDDLVHILSPTHVPSRSPVLQPIWLPKKQINKRRERKRQASWKSRLVHRVSPTSINVTNEDCMEEAKLSSGSVLEEISKSGDGRGPILVGGIGDSGTRGIQMLLSQLGVDMGNRDRDDIAISVNESFDSIIYMKGCLTTPSCDLSKTISFLKDQLGHNISKVTRPSDIYFPILARTKTLEYSETLVDDPLLWAKGIQFVSKVTELMYRQMMQDTQTQSVNGINLSRKRKFGIKHPRLALFFPLFKAALGKRFQLVHVIRDGRDVATGKNLNMYQDLCKILHRGEAHKCNHKAKNPMNFWALVNLQVHEWALANLPPEQYMVIRIEDVVDGRMDCIQKLADFVKVPMEDFRSRITDEYVQETFESHRPSYSGRKWTEARSLRFKTMIDKDALVARAMATFGYNSSEALPWSRSSGCAPF